MANTLAELAAGKSGTVSRLEIPDGRLLLRLTDMGIVPGTKIRLERIAPMGDPLEIALRGYTLSLRRREAEGIFLDGGIETRRDGKGISTGSISTIHRRDPGSANVRFRKGQACGPCGRCRPFSNAVSTHKANPRKGDGVDWEIALAGNPNTGKTTLFNALTGAKEYVGNWPGVTVERKERRLRVCGKDIAVVDLPGTYSLDSYSLEESITEDYLTGEAHGAVIQIADSTCLRRNLYLTAQLIELGNPVVLALNMLEEARKRGIHVDTSLLSEKLGIPVVPICARTGDGTQRLIPMCIEEMAKRGQRPDRMNHTQRPVCPPELQRLLNGGGGDAVSIARARYVWIDQVCALCVATDRPLESAGSAKIDRILTSRWLGIPIFLALMAGIFLLTFDTLGNWLSEGCVRMMERWILPGVGGLLAGMNARPWLTGLVCDGICGGAGSVLAFLPQIAILFFCLSLLEDSGYLARAAFLMDRAFRKLGLSGKSCIPMLLGFGCTVPAVVSARTMEREEERRRTILLLPFISCSAKLPVYGMIASAFFQRAKGFLILSLYLVGILAGALTGVLFQRAKGERNAPAFFLELPPYRLPTARNTFLHVSERVTHFVWKAGGMLLLMSVLLWGLLQIGPGLQLVQSPERSLLGVFGKAIAPAFSMTGFPQWQAVVALLTGIGAKEAVASSLPLLLGVSGEWELHAALQTLFTPLSAYCFLIFLLLYSPCMAAVAAMGQELGRKRDICFMVAYQILTAYLVSALIYGAGKLLGF